MGAPAAARRAAWQRPLMALGLVVVVGGALLLFTRFSANAQSAQLARPAAGPYAAPASAPAGSQVAIFAGGCFWCVESDFDKVPGVLSTTSGYTGGSVANPSYEQVSGGHTGHAEAVQVVFDPQRVSYRQLVDHYWHTIDPTTANRQFCDVGTPYRTAIFAIGEQQVAAAKASLAAIEQSKPFADPVVTPIVAASAFYPAEAYHQNYYQENPVRYNYYRSGCGRDARLKQLWGDRAAKH